MGACVHVSLRAFWCVRFDLNQKLRRKGLQEIRVINGRVSDRGRANVAIPVSSDTAPNKSGNVAHVFMNGTSGSTTPQRLSAQNCKETEFFVEDQTLYFFLF